MVWWKEPGDMEIGFESALAITTLKQFSSFLSFPWLVRVIYLERGGM